MSNVVPINKFFQHQIGDPVKSNVVENNEAEKTGKTVGYKRPPGYNSWSQMKQRCNNPNSKSFSDYGGRGIGYDPEWAVFDKFIADMGSPPSAAYSLERIDPNGNYERKNCRWASKAEQARNRRTTQRVTYEGKDCSLAALAERHSIALPTLRARLEAGLTIESALREPIQRGGYRGAPQEQKRSQHDCWPSQLTEATRDSLETEYQKSFYARDRKESRPQFFLRYTDEMMLELGEYLSGAPPDEVDPAVKLRADKLAAARSDAATLLDRLRQEVRDGVRSSRHNWAFE